MDAAPKRCPTCGASYDILAGFCQLDGSPLVASAPVEDPYLGRLLLGQFEVDRVLGVGASGTVYRARQRGLEHFVAIKILHADHAQNPDTARRFQREAKVCANLDHPNVLRVSLFGQLPGGGLYIVMEYLEGRPLAELLLANGRLDPARAVHIVAQICDGIGHAHGLGVVHRDIKPENVLLIERHGDADFVKVLDFGIARFLWAEQSAVTQHGLVFGTARYISPEGAGGEPTDARSDVYSIGVLAYQALSGAPPFDAPSPVALLMKHVHEPAPSLRAHPGGAHVPAPVADVVMRALAKNPDARYANAHELGGALREAAAAAGLAVSPPTWSLPAGPRAPGRVAAPAAAPPTSVPPSPPTPPVPPSAHREPTLESFAIPGLPRASDRRSLGAWLAIVAAFCGGAGVVLAVAQAAGVFAEAPEPGGADPRAPAAGVGVLPSGARHDPAEVHGPEWVDVTTPLVRGPRPAASPASVDAASAVAAQEAGAGASGDAGHDARSAAVRRPPSRPRRTTYGVPPP